MSILSLTRAAVIAGLVFVGATAATAQTAPQPPAAAPPAASDGTAPAAAGPAGRRGGGGALAACRGDIQTLCASVPAGKGAKVQCLVDNRAKASAGCQAAIDAVAAKRQGQANGEIGKTRPGKALAACQSDLSTLCSGSLDKPGKCLKQNAAKLSPACSTALAAVSAVADRVKASCQGDITSLCGADTKGRQAMQCLRQNQAKLSPGCSAVVAELPQRVRKATVQ